MLDPGVAARKHQRFVLVVGPPDQIRRLSVLTPYLEDEGATFHFAHSMALDHQSISDLGLHSTSFFSPTMTPAERRGKGRRTRM